MLFWQTPSTALFWAGFPTFFWGAWAAYTYDSLGRLTQTAFQTEQTYALSYDAMGNRTSETET
jgi:YD repeat-containing protein